MTPLQFVIAECSNHQSDGSCLGMMINTDLSITRGHALPRCLVADGQRCPYFEECVAPMADMVTDPRRSRVIKEAVMLYQMQHKDAVTTGRRCPSCGLPIQKGKQFCVECSAKKRKASNRLAQDRRRKQRVLLSAEVPKKNPKPPMISGGKNAVLQNPILDSHPPQHGQTSADACPSGRSA